VERTEEENMGEIKDLSELAMDYSQNGSEVKVEEKEVEREEKEEM
jgi:hypothetical protein